MRIAFDIALGAWVLSEWSVRLRSHLHRQGTRLDRNSMLVVVASAVAGVGGAIAVAKAVHVAAIPDPRWLVFVAGLVLMAPASRFASGRSRCSAGSSPSTCGCTRGRRSSNEARTAGCGTLPTLG